MTTCSKCGEIWDEGGPSCQRCGKLPNPPRTWEAERDEAAEAYYKQNPHTHAIRAAFKAGANFGYSKGLEAGRAEMKAEWQREHTAKVDYKLAWERLHADMERRGPFKMAAALTKEVERLSAELQAAKNACFFADERIRRYEEELAKRQGEPAMREKLAAALGDLCDCTKQHHDSDHRKVLAEYKRMKDKP